MVSEEMTESESSSSLGNAELLCLFRLPILVVHLRAEIQKKNLKIRRLLLATIATTCKFGFFFDFNI